MSLTNATAAPTTIQANGKEYRIKPLTLGDLGSLERWLQQDYMRLGREQAEQTTDKETKLLLIEQAFTKAREVSVLDLLGQSNSSLTLVVRVLYEALRKEQPEITIDEVEELFGSLTKAKAEEMYSAATDVGLEPVEDGAKKKAP